MSAVPIDEPVELTPYDPDWPRAFAAEAERIAEALGSSARIEHIGSTAVPGIPLAKPVIDIMICAPVDVRPSLAQRGYEDLGEAGVPGRIYLRRRDGFANFNIALVDDGGAHWRNNLAFRDFLRSKASAACEYAAAKEQAVAQGSGI